MQFRLLCMSSCAVLLVSSVGANSQGNARITGTIEDQFSAPVAGVTVDLTSPDRVLRTKSVEDGSFAFDDVPLGAYEVEIAAAGFAKQKLSLNLQDNTTRLPLSIVLRVGNIPDCGSDFSIAYGPPGPANPRVSGTVKDFDRGRAVRNAEVTISRTGGQDTAFRSSSDRAGRFVFENIPAGHYDFRVAKSGYLPIEIKQLLKPRENDVFVDATLPPKNKMVVCQ